MRSVWSKVDPKCDMTGVFIRRRKETEIDMDTQGEDHNEGRDRDGNEASTSLRMLRVAGDHQQQQETRRDPRQEPSQGEWLCLPTP